MTKQAKRKTRTSQAEILRDLIGVARLLNRQPYTVTELADETGLAWRRVYRIINTIREAGLPLRVTTQKIAKAPGRANRFRLNGFGPGLTG